MRVEGYIYKDGQKFCPTDVCDAVCCKTGSAYPGKPPPCEHLESVLCGLHKKFGKEGKPAGCASFPQTPKDIEHINRLAEKAGYSQKCQLYFTDD